MAFRVAAVGPQVALVEPGVLGETTIKCEGTLLGAALGYCMGRCRLEIGTAAELYCVRGRQYTSWQKNARQTRFAASYSR